MRLELKAGAQLGILKDRTGSLKIQEKVRLWGSCFPDMKKNSISLTKTFFYAEHRKGLPHCFCASATPNKLRK